MTNLDLSYGKDIHLFSEDDRVERSNVRLFKFTRPLEKGKADLSGRPFIMPDGSIFQHWGIWVEFDETNKGKGRCVYTFDADVETADDGKQKSAQPTQQQSLWWALTAGQFIVKVYAYYPADHESN